MSQNLTANSIRQMPQVTSPYLLDVKISELTANRLDQTTHAFANPQLRWIKLTMLAVLCRNRKLKSLRLKQFGLERFRNIRPVTQKQASVTFGQFPNHTNVMNVGRGKVKGLDHADRVDLHMKLKTIKGLVAQFFAIVGYALKELGAFGFDKKPAARLSLAMPVSFRVGVFYERDDGKPVQHNQGCRFR